MLVDAETLLPARDGFSRVFGEATERIKPELFESFVEITTPVLETVEEVESELRALRLEVAERAAQRAQLALHLVRSRDDRCRDLHERLEQLRLDPLGRLAEDARPAVARRLERLRVDEQQLLLDAERPRRRRAVTGLHYFPRTPCTGRPAASHA